MEPLRKVYIQEKMRIILRLVTESVSLGIKMYKLGAMLNKGTLLGSFQRAKTYGGEEQLWNTPSAKRSHFMHRWAKETVKPNVAGRRNKRRSK